MNLSVVSSKNQILADLYVSNEMKSLLSKFDGGAGNDDLKSELFEAMLNYPDEKIIDAHSRNEVMNIAAGIVQRMLFQKGSKFHRTYRKTVYEYSEAIINEADTNDIEHKKQKESNLEKLSNCIQKDLDFCEQVVIEAYLQEGSKTIVKQQTRLPERSFNQIFSNGVKKIKTGVMGKTIGNYVVFNVEFKIDCEENVNPDNINDLMDEFMEFMKYKLERKNIPSKRKQTNYVKEITEARLKSII